MRLVETAGGDCALYIYAGRNEHAACIQSISLRDSELFTKMVKFTTPPLTAEKMKRRGEELQSLGRAGGQELNQESGSRSLRRAAAGSTCETSKC